MKITKNLLAAVKTVAYANLIGAAALFFGLACAQWCAGYDAMVFDAAFVKTLFCMVPMIANSIVLFVITSIAQGRINTNNKIRIMRKKTTEELLRRASLDDEE